MKFSLEATRPSVVTTSDLSELVTAQETINQSWRSINISQKQLIDNQSFNEVQQIVDNVNFSINAISKYGIDAIKVLNVDGSLENLLGIPEKLITAEKAVNALEGLVGDAWEKIKQWFKEFAAKVRAFCEKIKNFFIKEKVVEKTVIQTVEKQVPVEVVKEVKVYVDKIIEKKVEVPVEPPVTIEDLQKVPGYAEFMKQAQELRAIVAKYKMATTVISNELSADIIPFLLGSKNINSVFSKYLRADVFGVNGDAYGGIDIGKWGSIFTMQRYDANEKYPVTNVTEWSKENYVKAWVEVENIFASDAVIHVQAIVDWIHRASDDIEGILLKNNDEDAEFMSERIKKRLKRMDADISDEKGTYSNIVQNLFKLRTACYHCLSDSTRFIQTRQDMVKILNRVAHIFMKVHDFAEKTKSESFW